MLTNTIINPKLLKEFSLIPLNFNTTEIENFIKLSETIWIIPSIGEAYYQELLYQVKNNEISEENSTALVEAIYPFLAMAVCYESLPSLWLHINETSITKGKNDTAEPASLKEMSYYEQFIRRQLEVRKKYCIEWLCQRKEHFPLFHNCQCCECEGGLKTPNPNWKIYSTKKRITEIN